MLSVHDGRQRAAGVRLLVLGVVWKWGRKGCIRDEIGAERQLQYICLVLTHVAFDFQCEVQKSFIMTQLLRDVCACACVFERVCVFSFL